MIPLLGRLAVAAVTKQDVKRFMHSVAAGETAKSRRTKPRGISNVRGLRRATRAVSFLGAIFAYARDHQTCPAHTMLPAAARWPRIKAGPWLTTAVRGAQ